MNLIQINERLKDMPLQAVRMYANGSNPQVPPYLALAELQRREKIAQQASIERGAADGPMPSIKEQIEQKAGLMALQQGRMQQGQQQMANQATRLPMSVPENVESAEEQPQAEDSGIARLPIKDDMYQFAGGGIITFSDGGKSWFDRVFSRADTERNRAEVEEERRRYAREEEEKRARELADAVAMGIYPTDVQIRPSGSMPSTAARSSGARTTPRTTEPSVRQAAPATQAAVQPQPAATEPAAARPATTGLPEIFTDPTFMGVVKESMKQKTPQQLFQEQQDLLKMYGLTGAAGLEQERRARERQQQYEASRPTGLQDLIRVFGQAGQYKGLSGVAPAYTSLQQQRRAEDLRFREEQDRLMDALEARRREEATARAGAIREDISKGKDIASRGAGTIAGEQMRAQGQFAIEAMRRESEKELANIRFEFERRLKAMPQARHPELKEQYVETLVRRGVPRDQAIEMSMRLGTASDKIDLEGLKALQKTLQTQLEPTSGLSKEARAAVQAQLDQVNRQMMESAGLTGAPAKVMSMADVRETATKNNKTVEQVIEAAKRAGYTIR